MKKNLKTTSPLKLRNTLLQNNSKKPFFNYQLQQYLYYFFKFWLLSLQEIPINYLVQLYIKKIFNNQKRKYYLKFKFLQKYMINKVKKKLLLYRSYRKFYKYTINFRKYLITHFWRPKHITACQLGAYQLQFYQSGISLNIPVFFTGQTKRFNYKQYYKNKTKKQKKIFIKDAKLQNLKLFFFKMLLERKLQQQLKIPVIINFRNLLFLPKTVKRLQKILPSAQKHFFFLKKDKLFLRSLYIFIFGFYFAQSDLIAKEIATRLTRSRHHWQTLKMLRNLLIYLRTFLPETSSFRVDIYGKIGAKTRTKFFRIISGSLPQVQTLANKIHYTYRDCYSFTGVFGIHVWLVSAL